ncbi:Tigger transposable element-derived protein 4 [Portunus trituberculatus]|uniref:Tigger transposable element-derived protein 4 n=1 Tax=Portunus trituberculatus TaxID=210409 RepID=A0A5B7EEE5_PORTR|nr:Tigger transposable element-derived protein 4 [Portunus trituberculatus]
MSNSGSDMTKGGVQMCQVARSVTQGYGVQSSELQPFGANRFVSQQSDIDRSAYQPFSVRKDTHQPCDVARSAHQFEMSRNAMPSFEMTRSHSQSFDTPRGIQPHYEMRRSSVQHHYDMTRGNTHSFEPHKSGNALYDMARGTLGYEMGRGSHQYEMPRMQPYEVRPTHPQQIPQLYNYDKGCQECPEPQDTGMAKGDQSKSFPDTQQDMEMLLKMPKTAPQPTVRTKPGQKTSGHPFDFAKGYAEELEMAKKAAQTAIQAKIKAQEEERAHQEAKEGEKMQEEKEAKGNTQPSEILKLYAQQLQMMKKAPKSHEAAKVPVRQQDGDREGGSNGAKKYNEQYFHFERQGKQKLSGPFYEDTNAEEEHGGDNVASAGSADNGDLIIDGDEGDPPPFEMAKYMAQLSARSGWQEEQVCRVTESTSDTVAKEERKSYSTTEATNSSGIPFSIELMKNLSVPLRASAKAVGNLKGKRDRQELTIANKAKLIEQVESRGARKKADIAREWGLRPSTLSTIMKNKEKILTQFKSQRYAVGRRRMRTAAYPDVEEALLMWFRYARAAGIPITGPVLQGMGVTLAQELGHPEFSCSVGWLDRFKARHGLCFNPKNSQDSATSGTFNEPPDRVPSPMVLTPNDADINCDVSSQVLFPPTMPAVAPDVTQAENSPPSWSSNAVSGLNSTLDTGDQLNKWFPENIAMEECGHQETVEDAASMWLGSTVPALLKDKSPRDIFTAGEAALFYNLLPDKFLAVKEEDGHKWTWVKERVTFLVAVNMDGSEKLPLLVIGQKPVGQRNNETDSATLPLPYETNDSAMMTTALFKSWLRQLDQEYQAANRTIAIILEDCPAHSDPKGLSNVQLFFLPTDTTSRLQPLEHGVIHTLKSLYRRTMLERMVGTLEAGRRYEITLREAMEVLQQSWRQIKSELIVESFKQAGLQAAQNPAESAVLGGEDTLVLLERARSLGLDIPREVTFESYLMIDSEVQTTVDQEEEAELRVDCKDNEEPTPPGEALQALATLRKFMVEQDGPVSLLDTLADMEGWVTKHIVKKEVSTAE